MREAQRFEALSIRVEIYNFHKWLMFSDNQRSFCRNTDDILVQVR